MGGGSKTTTKQNETQKVELPDWLNRAGQAAVNKATTISNTPFQGFTGETVAPLSSNQRAAISAAPRMATAGQAAQNTGAGALSDASSIAGSNPGAAAEQMVGNQLGAANTLAANSAGNWKSALDDAAAQYRNANAIAANTTTTGMTSADNAAALARLAGLTAINSTGTGQGDLDNARSALADARGYTASSAAPITADQISGYMSPYIEKALDPVIAQLQKVAGMNSVNLASKAAMGGSFGGSRYGLQEAQNQADLNSQVAETSGKAYSDAYNAAVAEAENEAARKANAAGLSQQTAAGYNDTAGRASSAVNDAISRLVSSAGASSAAGTTQSDLANAALNRSTQAGQNDIALGTAKGQLSAQDLDNLLKLISSANATATTQSGLTNDAVNRLLGISTASNAAGAAQSGLDTDALNRLLVTGNLAQQQGQNVDNAAYQQYQNEQDDPYKKLQALISAAGGVPYGSTTTAQGTTTSKQSGGLLGQLIGAGVSLGGAAIASDRGAKEDFSPVDEEDVLQKLKNLPIETYRYKPEVRDAIGDDGRTRMGPMSQDWGRAFHGNDNAKTIPMPEITGALIASVKALEKRTQHLRRAA